jgi:NADP-dependent 3-hydroxy acid dehydrogenase YdfG
MMAIKHGHIFNICSIASLNAYAMAEVIASANLPCLDLAGTCGKK